MISVSRWISKKSFRFRLCRATITSHLIDIRESEEGFQYFRRSDYWPSRALSGFRDDREKVLHWIVKRFPLSRSGCWQHEATRRRTRCISERRSWSSEIAKKALSSVKAALCLLKSALWLAVISSSCSRDKVFLEPNKVKKTGGTRSWLGGLLAIMRRNINRARIVHFWLSIDCR